ncbi:hypothetical protein HPB52_004963 [Rhipicephalus sanguineus]|uniref:Uncharacterized protein n=1 Tax=Rhipicephalus sanguineus TaxID=34632 RepID=A0A9D4PML2_RHISA|nr:hypothetical protein HPB52_004963 [Rhipicephalus sanguineus]
MGPLCANDSSSLGDPDVTAPLGLGTLFVQKPYESKTITNVCEEPSELTHPQLQEHSLPECADGHLAFNETKNVVATTFTRCTHLEDSRTCLCGMVRAAVLKGKGSQYLTTDHQRFDAMECNVSNTQAFSEKVSQDERMKVSPSLFPLPADGISVMKKRALDFTTTAPEESPRPPLETSGVNRKEESERPLDSVEDSAVEGNISIPTKPQKFVFGLLIGSGDVRLGTTGAAATALDRQARNDHASTIPTPILDYQLHQPTGTCAYLPAVERHPASAPPAIYLLHEGPSVTGHGGTVDMRFSNCPFAYILQLWYKFGA